MKALSKMKGLVVVFVCLYSLTMNAQDIHFTQFWNAPFQLSPAHTGVFDGDWRLHGNYRGQWNQVPVPWRTFYGAFDTKILGKKKNRKNFFSAGLLINHDRAGDSKLSTLQIGLQGSYTLTLNSRNAITAGLSLNNFQRSFRRENLQLGSQYNGKWFDAGIAHLDAAINGDNTANYSDVGAGLNWCHAVPEKRTTFDVGGGLFHINTPDKSFDDEEESIINRRFDFYGLGVIQIKSKFDLLLFGLGRYQLTHREHLIDAGLRYHLNQKLGRELAVQAGLGYRFNDGLNVGDAIAPHIGFLWARTWQVGLSYDINISEFTHATNNLGGPEVSIIYIHRKPIPNTPDYCPTCPLHF